MLATIVLLLQLGSSVATILSSADSEADLSLAAVLPSRWSRTTRHHDLLPLRISGFELAGSKEATLRDVNGGSRCPGANGMEPPGYKLSGPISLSECARLAGEQPLVAGFRWGVSEGVDQDAYMRLSRPSAQPMRVPLSQLFPTDRFMRSANEGFVCFIYMVNETTDEVPPFKSSVSTRFAFTGIPVQNHSKVKAGKHHQKSLEVQASRNSGTEVCTQRYSIVRFLQADESAFWFCYRPTAARPQCDAHVKEFHQQAVIMMVGSLGFLLIVSRILQGSTHLSFCLEWLAKVILNQMLAFVVCIFLLEQGLERYTFSCIVQAMLLLMSANAALQLPYIAMRRSSLESLRVLATFCLFAVVYSPSIYVDMMSYYKPLPLLFAYQPRVLGVVGFGLDALAHFAFKLWSEKPGELEKSGLAADVENMYAPMQLRLAATPAPTPRPTPRANAPKVPASSRGTPPLSSPRLPIPVFPLLARLAGG